MMTRSVLCAQKTPAAKQGPAETSEARNWQGLVIFYILPSRQRTKAHGGGPPEPRPRTLSS